jgi:Mg2+ and Co2+ transporter CorA
MTVDGNVQNEENRDIEAGRVMTERTPLFTNSERSTKSIHPLPGMQIRAHVIKPDGNLQVCAAKEALARGRAGKGSYYWIDVDADERDTEELREWLEQLKIPSFLRSRLAEPPDTWASQVFVYRSSLLAMIRVLPQVESSDEIAHVAVLCVKHLLLTFTSCARTETGGLYADALQYMHARERLPAPSSTGALFVWLLFHVERSSRASRELRSFILNMDEAMDRDVTSVDLEEIINVKEQMMRVLSVVEEQTECLEGLAEAEMDTESLDLTQLRGTLGVILATSRATERMALRLEKHIQDLRQRYDAHQQERINRRLAVLTVISAIFLPLTLITGIWGMNFQHMPELSKPEAYPLALLVMFMIAVTMLCYFWRSGWFE